MGDLVMLVRNSRLELLRIIAMFMVVFPTVFPEYWFFTAYICLFFCLPYINRLIEKLSCKEYQKFIVVVVLIWSIIPTLQMRSYFGSGVIDLFVYYLIGAYFRKYPPKLFKHSKLRRGFITVAILTLFVAEILLFLIPFESEYVDSMKTYLMKSNSAVALLFSVGIFIGFIYSKPFFNKAINTISSCTFGVYLIHDNPVIRELLWLGWFDNTNYYNSPYLLIRILFSVIIVFVVCIMIEFVRKKTIAKPFENLLIRFYERIEFNIKNYYERYTENFKFNKFQ